MKKSNSEMVVKAALSSPIALILCAITFIEFVVFGSWFSTLGLILQKSHHPEIIGSAYFVSAIAAICSPVILGAICDRYFAPKTVLSFLHVTGGLIMFCLPEAISSGNDQIILWLIFIYMLTFQPTLGMVNAISLDLLGENQSHFPFIRMFGPLGWVFIGLIIGFAGYSASTVTFYITGATALVMAVVASFLPFTTPAAKGEKFSLSRTLGAGAFKLLKNRQYGVLMLCVSLTSILLGFYNTFSSPFFGALNITNVAGVLSMGQLTEVIFISLIPWSLARFGVKTAMLFGMSMWALRFALFSIASFDNSWAAIAAVFLHGLCNDFVIVIAAMYIAVLVPPQLANQAQGMLILVISGLGAAGGSFASGLIYQHFSLAASPVSDWVMLWAPPIAVAVTAAFIWTLFFPPVADFRSR